MQRHFSDILRSVAVCNSLYMYIVMEVLNGF